MPTHRRGLQGLVKVDNRSGGEHPLAGREGRNEHALIVPLGRIRPDPNQPRKSFDVAAITELAATIKEHGVLQPLLVYLESDVYYIVAGERRYRAAHEAGLTDVPVQVLQEKSRIRELQLIENLQRESLNLMEEARALGELQSTRQTTVRGLEQATGKSKSYISRRLALLKMPEDVQNMLERAPQLFSQAESVAQISDKKRREARIQSLLQGSKATSQAVKYRTPGRPVKPFALKKRRSGGFDLTVKFRPGATDVDALVSELKALLAELER